MYDGNARLGTRHHYPKGQVTVVCYVANFGFVSFFVSFLMTGSIFNFIFSA
jgi:hypothetical protein